VLQMMMPIFTWALLGWVAMLGQSAYAVTHLRAPACHALG
jgi:hypothetical protein